MLGKLHLIAKIRCNLNDISYFSETQKNFNSYNYQLLTLFFLLSIFNYVFLKITFPVNNVSCI